MTGVDILNRLSAPFDDNDVEWRAQRFVSNQRGTSVLVVPYIQSRAVMNRLDEVVGLFWKDEYREVILDGKNAIQCALSIKVGDEWITRTDGAETTDVESFKGGISNALKRAAVKFGIGRYLYDSENVWLPLYDKRTAEATLYVSGKLNKQPISGFIAPPSLSTANARTQKPTPPVQSQKPSQQPQQQSQMPPVNHAPTVQQACDSIYKLLEVNGTGTNYVPYFLERIGVSCTKLEDASIDQLETLYHVIKPVADFLQACRNANLDLPRVYYYAQVVLGAQIQHVMELYFMLNYDFAAQAIELIKADVMDAQKQQRA